MKRKPVLNEDLLTVNGTKLLLDFNSTLDNLMATDEVHDMSKEQVEILGFLLTQIIEKAISKRLDDKEKEFNQYTAMSDEEFTNHLIDRYGDGWALMTLTPEELARFPKPDLKKIAEEMNIIGESFRQYLESNGVRLK